LRGVYRGHPGKLPAPRATDLRRLNIAHARRAFPLLALGHRVVAYEAAALMTARG